MQCIPCKQVLRAMRHFFFAEAQESDDRTKLIDQNINEIRRQKALTSEMIAKVNQPDVLRSLVISMTKQD